MRQFEDIFHFFVQLSPQIPPALDVGCHTEELEYTDTLCLPTFSLECNNETLKIRKPKEVEKCETFPLTQCTLQTMESETEVCGTSYEEVRWPSMANLGQFYSSLTSKTTRCIYWRIERTRGFSDWLISVVRERIQIYRTDKPSSCKSALALQLCQWC